LRVERKLLVLLDTSILMHLSDPSVRIESLWEALGKVQLCVPDAVRAELEKISRSRTKRGRIAKFALEYASSLPSYPGQGKADDILAEAAASGEVAVATMDHELIRRIRSAGGTVITFRSNRAAVVKRDRI
jgi:rRNA-processing protein FCF1